MKWHLHPLTWALAIGLIITARADDAADKAKWRAQIEASTQSIAAGGDDIALIIAYYNRAAAHNNLQEFDTAATDVDASLEHISKLPAGPQESQAWVQAWSLKGDIAVGQRNWDEARKDYENATKRSNFATSLGDFVGTFYYNASRANAHVDLPYYSHLNADKAIEFFAAKTGDENKRMHMLSLRQRAIARYGEGDLDGAQSDWAAAKLLEPKLGDAPFDSEQAPLNKAVANGREKERIARARYMLDRARELDNEQAGDEAPDLEPGGTVSLSDATAPVATPLTLASDALNDLDMAIHRDIGDTWGLQNFDIALERGRGRAFVFELDPDGKHFTPHQVDDELNRAVELRPFDVDAHRARADWLVYRLGHLNEMAEKSGLPHTKREATRTALLSVANDDLGRVLLANPADISHHVARARLLVEQPSEAIADQLLVGAPGEDKLLYSDPNAIAYDIEAALKAPADPVWDGEQAIADHIWATAQNALTTTPPKPAGTALEWKEKAKVASAANDTDTALEDLNKALAIDPNFADALNNRGTVYIVRAQWDLALRDFDAAIRVDPKHRVAYMNRAVVKRDVGNFDGSVTDARQAIVVAPNDDIKNQAQKGLRDNLFARADALSEKIGTLAGAYADYHEGNALSASLKLPPDSKWLQYEGTMAAQIGRGPEAMTALRAAHAAKPDDVWVEGWLTVVATALNEPDAATLEKEVEQRGDRNTLSNLDDVTNSLKRDGKRLTNQPDAEVARLESLHSRLFDAYYNKPGGTVINGGDKTN
ncbi:hypothetical protein IAD21_01097 [Abditibacteriota bacterium]|nr:hypothetical protein IAD21_01097 [Abditibacteriota bacterium]